MDAMEGVTKYITDLFNGDEMVVPGDEMVVLATGAAPVMEKLEITNITSNVSLLPLRRLMDLESLTEILSFGAKTWMSGPLFTWFTVWNLLLPLGKAKANGVEEACS